MKSTKFLFRSIVRPILIACILALALRSVIRIYAVPSASMTPLLLPGDRILVTRFLSDEPARGDVVVFRAPGRNDLLVKRVIAVPGDLVDTHLGRVRIGGREVSEPYVQSHQASDIAPQLVPADHLFVLGDNRADSFDSRSWGPLPRRLIVGRARLILWHRGSASRIFKWID